MYDLIIIGAGIAGMTSAIYAARKRMKYEILSTDIGGQFMVSGEVLNYPGIIQTSGFEFKKIMDEQLKFNKVNPKIETVNRIEKQDTGFKVISEKEEYITKAVIIATGGRARKLNVPGEKKLSKKGVTYCAICDGPLFSGMDVAVVGGGDSALESVDFLKDIASKIYLLVRGDQLKGHEYLQERVKANPKVEIMYNTQVKELYGEVMLEGAKILHGGAESDLKVHGVFIEIGRIPNTEPFKELLDVDKSGHIIMNCHGETSMPGIFAAGDCAAGSEYQYVISAGQGCMSLIKAAKYIATHKLK